ncbi:MAG: hypothetical protein ACOYOK_11210 [Pseudobdellovibrionaceae bacterium]
MIKSRTKSKWVDEKGGGAILFVSVITGLLLVVATYNLTRTSNETIKQSQKEGALFAANIIRTSITGYLEDPESLSYSTDDAKNAKFKNCFSDTLVSPCAIADGSGFFLLKGRKNEVLYLPKSSADPIEDGWSENGFDRQGRVCVYDPSFPENCPYSVKIKWTMVCKNPVDPCENPRPRFDFSIRAKSKDSELSISSKQMNFTVQPTKEEYADMEKVCISMGGKFADETKECSFPEAWTKTSCLPHQYIKSINPKGTPECVDLTFPKCQDGKRVSGVTVKTVNGKKVEEFICI